MKRNFLYSALQLLFLGVAPALFLPVIVRLLNTEDFASLVLLQAVTGFLSVIVQFGLHIQGPVQYGAASTVDEQARVFYDALYAKTVLLLAVILALAYGTMFTPDGRAVLFLFVLLPIGFWFHSVWFLQSQGEFRVGAMGALVGVLLGAVLLAIAPILHEDWRLALAVLALVLPQLSVGVMSFFRAQKGLPVPRFSLGRAWMALRNGGGVAATHLLMLAYLSSGTLVVGYFHDAADISAYAAMEKVFNVASVCLVLIYSTPYPKLAAAYQQSPKSYWALLGKILTVYMPAAGLVVLVVSFLGGDLAAVYLGRDLVPRIEPDLPLFGYWLAGSVILHMAVGHLTIIGRKKTMIVLVSVSLLITLGTGSVLCQVRAGWWVIGMLAGLLPCLFVLLLEFLRYSRGGRRV